MKLGKPTDIQKTPSRGGLGMIINESKTPGARSLQSLASARKATTSVVKNTLPLSTEFEIFQDETEEEPVEEQKKQAKTIENSPCSPIDTVNRCQNYDSFGADMAYDLLNYPDQDVILHEEKPLGDYIDPKGFTDEEMASLGIEPWDEYPPIDLASRRSDDFNEVIQQDDFYHEADVVLEEASESEYPYRCPISLEPPMDHAARQTLRDRVEKMFMEDDEDIHSLIEEAAKNNM
ncbi:hypothetical protein CAEBREN_05078 [Caenorhabditis brenneri]|uniref:Uncharacterized protein n=1 Tax=Caenorhabditis brenneri TaxID=135651 RepID=G0NAM1_CAEBE|nr:hypothetical protein CAEBREN_05078 [Caenorhabditis brenneri]